MTRKKKLVILSIILLLVIVAVVIALLCFGKPSGEPAPEQTEPTVSTGSSAPSDGSTTPPTAGSAVSTDPTGTVDPSVPTDPTGTADPFPTETVNPSAPTQAPASSNPTAQPTQPAPQPTKPAARPTSQPTNPATQQSTQPTTPSPMTIHTPCNLTISVGQTLQIDYSFTGNAANLSWSSNDTSVFTVDNNGLVTGKGTGVALATACDGYNRWSVYINVVAKADKTTAFDLQIDCPLYDGITKFAGHYLQINHLNSNTLKANGNRNNIISEWQAAGSASDPSKPDPAYPTRNYYITSSNPAVVSVVNKFDCGFYDDFLYFNKAGTAVITVTSWDGYSESYTVHVKDDYDCAPGKSKLTPGEFAYYATAVGVEDGLEASYQIRSYLYIWYDEDELTWEQAKSLGHGNAKREFCLGSDTTSIVYAGFDESNGKHLFYHGMGEPGGKLAPYTPAKASTGKIRFPSKSINIMEKTLKVVEVLGDTRDEFVVYTSSDPSIVEASGSLLIAKRPGTATVTATYQGQTATMTVTVTMDPSIERILFDQDTYTFAINEPAQLTYTYNGTSELTWESSDESVARIDIMGTLVLEGEGECTIRLRSVDDYFVVDSCKIIVTDPIDYPDAANILFADTADALYDGMELRVGDVLILEPYTVPADSWTEVLCDSSDYNAVSIDLGWDDDRGRNVYYLVCNEAGTVTVTLSSSDGCVSKSYRITVKDR